MVKIKEHQTEIKEYGGNLIKVGIWNFLAQKRGEISDLELKASIQKELEITPRQLTAYLDNVSQPKIEEFYKIAQILECTVNDLISEKK